MKLQLTVKDNTARVRTFTWTGEKAPSINQLKRFLLEKFIKHLFFSLDLVEPNGVKKEYSGADIISEELAKPLIFKTSFSWVSLAFTWGAGPTVNVYSVQNQNRKKLAINQDAVSADVFDMSQAVKDFFQSIAPAEQSAFIQKILKKTILRKSQEIDGMECSLGSGATHSTVVCYRAFQAAKKAGVDEKKANHSVQIAVAQIADSSVNLVTSTRMTRLSPVHNPRNPIEAERVQATDVGFISQNYVRSKACDNGLAVTRSLGDRALRTAGVISDPAMSTHTVTDDDTLLLCSDGYTDYIPESKIPALLVEPELEATHVAYATGKDDVTRLKITNLSAIVPGEFFVASLSDGHGKQGHDIARFSVNQLSSYFDQELKAACRAEIKKVNNNLPRITKTFGKGVFASAQAPVPTTQASAATNQALPTTSNSSSVLPKLN